MSHNVGRVVTLASTRIGPDGPLPPVSPGVWEHSFSPQPALGGGNPQFVIVHLANLALPGTSRVEVELGYDTDVITSAMGSQAWSRPIDGDTPSITIRFVGSAGGATFADYGSGEPTTTTHPDDPWQSGVTNADLFLHGNPYDEPTYQQWLECGGAFDWQNAACAAGDPVKKATANAVGMIINYHIDDETGQTKLSTCTVTLIDTDLVVTARHCVADPNDLEVLSGSVTFDFATDCSPVGGKPVGYAPRFHKVRARLANGGWLPITGGTGTNGDWAILQIDPPPAGITPRTFRTTATVVSESVFAVHHPNGAVKKIQSGTLQSGDVGVVSNFDYSGGSSGSSLFDANGQIVGAALSYGNPGYFQCQVGYSNPAGVVSTLANPSPPVVPVDVMLVMDRSGSMSELGTSGPGRTKMIEARDAASLFVQLVRTGQGHRMGMVSFSSSASVEEAPANFTNGQQNQLVGPSSPYTGGSIGALTPGGSTSIGDGIQDAMAALSGLAANGNSRALLLMTDGMQNTPPMVAAVESTIGNAEIHAVGFGSEAQLDGALLSRLAADHMGIYTRANDGFALKKFFGLCFGNIFEAGSLADPVVELKAGQAESEEIPFDVCEEDAFTVIVGWDAPTDRLEGVITTPGGAVVVAGAGVSFDVGSTWWFARLDLPYQGEREGTWHVRIRRAGVSGGIELTDFAEFSDVVGGREERGTRAFVSVVPTGGPRMRPIPPSRRLYTGDRLSPQVALLYPNGTAPFGEVEATIEGPGVALGGLVARHGLASSDLSGEPIDAFHATLMAIAAESGGQLPLGSTSRSVKLLDEPASDGGVLERDGVYGMPMDDVLQFEGTYQIHAIGRYGDSCRGQRDTSWSIQVFPGIDPGKSGVDVKDDGPADGGGHKGSIVFTPRDRYGHPLGPGRGTLFDPGAAAGTNVTGPVTDNGDGSYTIPVSWDPAGAAPGLVVSQPDRPGVPIGPAFGGGAVAWWCRWPWLPWLLVALIVVLIVLLLLLLLLT